MSNGVIGTGGFIAWFYGAVILKIIHACENIIVKIFIHLIGLILAITGLFVFITSMPSIKSIIGMFLVFIGLILFVIPFAADKHNSRVKK